LSKVRSSGFGMVQEDDRIPELFLRGRVTYSANLNAANPMGTVQSIEHTLRNLDKLALDQRNRCARIEKDVADYREQADRPFEHEERLKELLGRQAELNALLDLDKGDQQGAGPSPDEPETERAVCTSESHEAVAALARAYMRESGTAIREVAISERTAPQIGAVPARVVAKGQSHIALATGPNSFFVLTGSFGRDVQIGERICFRFHQGRASIDDGRGRGI
jgi:hypothetical protein